MVAVRPYLRQNHLLQTRQSRSEERNQEVEVDLEVQGIMFVEVTPGIILRHLLQ